MIARGEGELRRGADDPERHAVVRSPFGDGGVGRVGHLAEQRLEPGLGRLERGLLGLGLRRDALHLGDALLAGRAGQAGDLLRRPVLGGPEGLDVLDELAAAAVGLEHAIDQGRIGALLAQAGPERVGLLSDQLEVDHRIIPPRACVRGLTAGRPGL